MLVRKIALLAVTSAMGIVAFGASSASAASWITDELGNFPTNITSTASDPATLSLSGGFGDITCNTTTFNLHVGPGGGASIDGSLNTLVFENCTDSIPVITITACDKHGGSPTATITAGAGGGSVTLSPTTVFCTVAGSANGCYYQAPDATGVISNATNSITFTNTAVTHTVPAGTTNDLGNLCGAGGAFNVTLTHVVNAANNSTVTLLTNP
jgi:hypothetical protein